MFASIDGANPGYMALAPDILALRHVSLPPILGNNRVAHSSSCFEWLSSAEVLVRMDGGYPECMANLKSTLRWASE